MRRQCRGSAIVETALSVLVASVLLSGSVFIGRTALAARRAHGLARYAAALSAAGVPADIVDAEVRDYASHLETDLSWTLGRYAGSASATFYRLSEAKVAADIALPPLAGGGHRTMTERAVVEEEHP